MQHDRHCLFTFNDPDDYQRLHDVLTTAGYSDAGILGVLGVTDFPSIRSTDVPLLMRRTNNGTILDALIRLFLVDVPVPVPEIAAAIAPMALETWIAAGLVGVGREGVVARIRLLPYQGLFVAFDRPQMLQSDARAHFVMGIGASSLTLANLTIRKPIRHALDLGAGCGIQALLAAQHCERVLASDKNMRAVQLADFNAKLNGFSHLDCVAGDLFEPAGDRQFDLVVTNPPFVISPETSYIYRDGGMPADQICQRIVREVPRHLTDGGFCQILCNWAETHKDTWQDRLEQWVSGTGCDVWVIRSESRDAETYAATWIRHTEPGIDARMFARRFDNWMAYYETHGIDAISAGLITMRRSDAHANWFRAEDGPEKMIGPCGEDILLGFDLHDYLSSTREHAALLETSFRVSPNVRLNRQARPGEQAWLDESLQLQHAKGLAYIGNIDPYVANLIIGCNGHRPLKNLMADMAQAMGEDDSGKIAEPLIGVVRGLVSRGFLLPQDIWKDQGG